MSNLGKGSTQRGPLSGAPRYTGVRLPSGPGHLTKEERMHAIRVLTAERILDVETTNKQRIQFALEHAFGPLRYDGANILYRTISFDPEGLIQIAYQLEKPELVPAISKNEMIGQGLVRTLLDLDYAQTQRLIKDERVRREGTIFVNYHDVLMLYLKEF